MKKYLTWWLKPVGDWKHQIVYNLTLYIGAGMVWLEIILHTFKVPHWH